MIVDIWNKLEGGDEEGARQLFNRLLPLMNYERLYGVAVYKLILHRRGLIETPLRRAPGGDLDNYDMAELEKVLAGVEPLFSI